MTLLSNIINPYKPAELFLISTTLVIIRRHPLVACEGLLGINIYNSYLILHNVYETINMIKAKTLLFNNFVLDDKAGLKSVAKQCSIQKRFFGKQMVL